MGNSLIRIILMLLLFLLRIECQCSTQLFICTDEFPDSYKKCVINTTEYNVISEHVYNCSIGMCDTLEIQIARGDVNITVYIPHNIISLKINNPMGADNINVEAVSINPHLKKISIFGDNIQINQPAFFRYFINLRELQAQNVTFKYLPIFTHNKQMRRMIMNQSVILNDTDRLVKKRFVSGLNKLESLIWKRGGIVGILENSFYNLRMLSRLDLTENEIHELEDNTFDGLRIVMYLGLASNRITSVKGNSLTKLKNLKIIDLADNPTFPLDSIAQVRSLEKIILSHYNATYLVPYPFQQLMNLTNIGLDHIHFPCDCSNQWISKLHLYGIGLTKIGSVCLSKEGSVDDTSLYSDCGINEYPCFNHSQTCRTPGARRVDSGGSCLCCVANTSANLTDRGYQCSCMEGFRYSKLIPSACEENSDRRNYELITLRFAEENVSLLLLLVTTFTLYVIMLILIFLLITTVNMLTRKLRVAGRMQGNNVLSVVQNVNTNEMKELDITSYDSEYHQLVAERDYKWVTYRRDNAELVYSNIKDEREQHAVKPDSI